MTRDDIQLFSWFPPPSSLEATVSEDPHGEEVSGSPGLKDVTQPDIYIPNKSSVTEAIQSFFFSPGLHFDGANISFIRQMPMFDRQNIGDANTCKMIQNVHVNQKIRKV